MNQQVIVPAGQTKSDILTIDQVIDRIQPVPATLIDSANQYLDILVKPPRSLGHLEDLAARLSAIGGQRGYAVQRRCVLVFAADNGVVAEGVSSAPQVVTALQTQNILNGVAGMSVLAKRFATDFRVIDVGIATDLEHPDLIVRKIAASTGNIATGPAMTREQVLQALVIGIEAVENLAQDNFQAIGLGEMGIGNTTTSSAVLSALLGLHGDRVAETVGRGAGLTDADFTHKVAVIQQALDLNQPDPADMLDVLAKVGGFDLAAMTGAYLAAAALRLPAVIDGFISVVAALCATRLAPPVRDYLFASHQSFERGYGLALAELGLEAPLHLNMRLGEGSGCPLLFNLMDAASSMMQNMATLNDTGIQLDYAEDVNF